MDNDHSLGQSLLEGNVEEVGIDWECLQLVELVYVEVPVLGGDETVDPDVIVALIEIVRLLYHLSLNHIDRHVELVQFLAMVTLTLKSLHFYSRDLHVLVIELLCVHVDLGLV